MELTISGAGALTSSGEIECLAHGHFSDVKVILADVCRGLLWHKLVKRMAIECDLALYTEILVKLPSQCEEQCGLS